MWKDLFDANGAAVMVNFDRVTHFTANSDSTTRIYFGEATRDKMIVVNHTMDELMKMILEQSGSR